MPQTSNSPTKHLTFVTVNLTFSRFIFLILRNNCKHQTLVQTIRCIKYLIMTTVYAYFMRNAIGNGKKAGVFIPVLTTWQYLQDKINAVLKPSINFFQFMKNFIVCNNHFLHEITTDTHNILYIQ